MWLLVLFRRTESYCFKTLLSSYQFQHILALVSYPRHGFQQRRGQVVRQSHELKGA